MVRFYHGYESSVYYITEGTEGTTPTNPAMLNLAQKTDVTWSDAPNPIVVAKSGSVDNSGIEKGIENPVITFTFNPSQGSGKDFIKNFTSTDSAFTLLVLTDEASDIVHGRFVGCKVKRISCSVKIYPQATALECTVEIWAWSIAYSFTIGSGSLESAPSSFVNWSNITVKRNTVTITDWWDIDWSCENDLFRMPDNTGATSAIERGRRAVKGTWTRSANSTTGVGETELTETKNATDVDLQFSIVADTYDFVNSVYEEVTVNHPITEMVGIKGSFTAESFAIA